MAAPNPLQSLQDDATCSLCLEYYNEPVFTKCGHNFCRPCITVCLRGPAPTCPQCRAACPPADLRPNRHLKGMVEAVRQLSVQRKRSREGEALCGTRPPGPGEALCGKHREKLKLFCKEDKRLICVICRESREHKLHTVLPAEEAGLGLEDVVGTLKRCEKVQPRTPESKWKKYKVLVTLDPDTANGCLTLSAQGKRVTVTNLEQRRPYNPKRFTASRSVLGREGFSSGRHYWELQLLHDGVWSVGVAQESVNRKEWVKHTPAAGFWTVRICNGHYKALSSPHTPLSPHQTPKKLGLYLDYEGGRLSLYNADTTELIYTFSRATFTGWIYPFIWLKCKTDLRLL